MLVVTALFPLLLAQQASLYMPCGDCDASFAIRFRVVLQCLQRIVHVVYCDLPGFPFLVDASYCNCAYVPGVVCEIPCCLVESLIDGEAYPCWCVSAVCGKKRWKESDTELWVVDMNGVLHGFWIVSTSYSSMFWSLRSVATTFRNDSRY